MRSLFNADLSKRCRLTSERVNGNVICLPNNLIGIFKIFMSDFDAIEEDPFPFHDVSIKIIRMTC